VSPVGECQNSTVSKDHEIDKTSTVIIGDLSLVSEGMKEVKPEEFRIRKRMKDEAIEVGVMDLTGRWKTRSGEIQCIGLGQIQWNEGTVSHMRARLKGFSVEVHGTTYQVVATSRSQLLWSDGDIWVRDTALPTTGTLRQCAVGAEVASGITGLLLGYLGLGTCAFGKAHNEVMQSDMEGQDGAVAPPCLFDSPAAEPLPWDKIAAPSPPKQPKRSPPKPRPKRRSLSSRASLARRERDSFGTSIDDAVNDDDVSEQAASSPQSPLSSILYPVVKQATL